MPLDQSAFRFRDDDGNETGASWLAALDTDLTGFTDVDTNIRLRIETTNTEVSPPAISFAPQLQYSLNSGTWTNVTDISSVVRANDSTNLTDDEDTTEQLAGAGTFVTGKVDDDTGATTGLNLGPGQQTEHEFCFHVRSVDVTTGDVVELRSTSSGTAYGSYSVVPSITVAVGDASYPHGVGAGFWLRLMVP